VTDPEQISPPSPALLALEGRAWLEFAAILPAWPILGRAPRGDGHPVLILPGWLASDFSTRMLRWYLRDRGYHAHGWRLGRNHGPNAETVTGLVARLRALRERHTRRVSLIGWSLGGIYARELARNFPDHVRQVITLASPFRDPGATSVARLYRLRDRLASSDERARDRAGLGAPLPVPMTSIYSPTDGVVAWRSCLGDAGPRCS
jgi:pimeloyl-ACP methyl ester carboxylesterase